MLVDDEAFNLIGIKTVIRTIERFRRLSHLIDTACNGQEALELARAGLEKEEYTYCFVFMDLQMPIMDGYEATEAIRDLYENASEIQI